MTPQYKCAKCTSPLKLEGSSNHLNLPLCKQCGGIFEKFDVATSTQVGGDHYRSCKIQPVEFIEANDLGFLEGCVIKRVVRHDRGGKGWQDIEKAIHELQLLLQFRYGASDERR